MPLNPRSWTVVRATWLTQKPKTHAALVAAWALFFLTFAAIIYLRDWGSLASWMGSNGEEVFQKKEYWRLWTSLFAHADAGHLISNSLLFFIFGYFLYGYFGLLVFPFGAILAGGLVQALSLLTYPPGMNLIGMSGVVYWMGGFWLFLYLNLDQQRTLTQRWLRVLGVSLALFMPSSAFDPQVSYRAHLIGFLVGALMGAAYYFWRQHEFLQALKTETLVEEEDEGSIQNLDSGHYDA
jgi:rhomboid protease GluP